MSDVSTVFQLIPAAQKYDWGKPAKSSSVARFASASGITIDESAPYAELWMGTHPSAPSRLTDGTVTLSEHLQRHPELIGAKVLERFHVENGNLPFLLKILAIDKALSIQTHPDKSMAEKLHAERPDIYKDDNHKPEMALAITPFTALCGFQPLESIAARLEDSPEFAALVPPEDRQKLIDSTTPSAEDGAQQKAALRAVFTAVMTAPEHLFKEQLSLLIQRYTSSAGVQPTPPDDLKELVLRLHSQFPGDIGIFCAFMLNYVKLTPGEAIFLGAGEPHAYVSGDIVECMATSDNVIRAGLTPKLRDVPNLVSGLTYVAAPSSKHVVKPATGPSGATKLYDPPVPEFAVLQTVLPAGASEEHPALDGPSIAIATHGRGKLTWPDGETEINTGEVFFVGAGTPLRLTSQGEADLVLHRAFVEAT